MRNIEWAHQDSNREYWKIEAEALNGDETEWKVKILFSANGDFTDNKFTQVHAAKFTTQPGKLLRLSEIIDEWMNYTSLRVSEMSNFAGG